MFLLKFCGLVASLIVSLPGSHQSAAHDCFLVCEFLHAINKFVFCLDYFLILFRAKCSGGMNGYLSPCAGDPRPPIFRSPVAGMEDIIDNQVT
jgi:hypothetical protein